MKNNAWAIFGCIALCVAVVWLVVISIRRHNKSTEYHLRPGYEQLEAFCALSVVIGTIILAFGQ